MIIMNVSILPSFLLQLLIFTSVVQIFAQNSDGEKRWDKFKKLHGKNYDNAKEASSRKSLFLLRDQKIQKHNSQRSTWVLGHNPFSDMSENEALVVLGLSIPPKLRSSREVLPIVNRARKLPPYQKEVNYTSHRCMPPVKDQGKCGDCWAFSAITPLEFLTCSKNMRNRNHLLRSEQQLVDCDYGNMGCDGGFYSQAWDYLKLNGSMPGSKYPYESGVTEKRGKCRYRRSSTNIKPTGYVSLPQDAEAISHALSKFGPVSAGFAVIQDFFSYESGIYDNPACDAETPNHAIVLVGYGTDKSSKMDYWFVRNTWGTSWGQNGYFQIRRGVNRCGIESLAYYVIV